MEKLQQLVDTYQPGYGLRRDFYIEPEVFDLDIKHIYARSWLFAGHISEIPNPGDFVLYDVASESLILIRDSNGEIKAFLNVCRHRGSRLCLTASGHLKEFVCPYHAWSYNLAGELIRAKRMSETFDFAQHSLYECGVTVVHGLIFICFSSVAPDFEPVTGVISRFLYQHGLERAKIVHSLNLIIQANWKIVAENSWECYHCPASHPLFTYMMPYSRVTASDGDRHRQNMLQREWEKKAQSMGHVTGHYGPSENSIIWCQRNPVRTGCVTQSEDGKSVAPLMGDYKEYDRGVTGIQIFPVCWFSLCNDYALLTRITPLSSTVTETKYYWLVDDRSREGVDYELERLTHFWRITADEDKVLSEANQKGVSSIRYEPGPLSETEADIVEFHKWYLRQLVN